MSSPGVGLLPPCPAATPQGGRGQRYQVASCRGPGLLNRVPAEYNHEERPHFARVRQLSQGLVQRNAPLSQG